MKSFVSVAKLQHHLVHAKISLILIISIENLIEITKGIVIFLHKLNDAVALQRKGNFSVSLAKLKGIDSN